MLWYVYLHSSWPGKPTQQIFKSIEHCNITSACHELGIQERKNFIKIVKGKSTCILMTDNTIAIHLPFNAWPVLHISFTQNQIFSTSSFSQRSSTWYSLKIFSDVQAEDCKDCKKAKGTHQQISLSNTVWLVVSSLCAFNPLYTARKLLVLVASSEVTR